MVIISRKRRRRLLRRAALDTTLSLQAKGVAAIASYLPFWSVSSIQKRTRSDYQEIAAAIQELRAAEYIEKK